MTGQPRVAYVDDEPSLRRLVTQELIDQGVEPLSCSTGQELLDLLNNKKVDLILLDLMMPIMDGMTCLRHLKERNLEIPVLIVTGINDDNKRKETIELGAADYILKPDLLEQLAELLNKYLKCGREEIH